MNSQFSKLVNRRTLILPILLALAVYAFLGVKSELGGKTSAWSGLHWQYVALAFGLSLINYFFRFCNWQFYLKSIGIYTVPRLESLLIFIGGFALGITPGKVGEVVRSVLLKERHGIPLSKTGSLILVDRLTDVLALILIGSIGMVQLRYGFKILIVFTIITVGALIVLSSRTLSQKFLNVLKRISWLAKYEVHFERLYHSAYTLLQPSKLWVIMLLSLVSWSCEALGFYLIFQAFGITISLNFAFFIYSFSTLIGAAALLPGGLGLTEGSMTGLLVLLQVKEGVAAAATVLIRLATLWFGLVLGIISLAILEAHPHLVQQGSKEVMIDVPSE